MKNIALAFYIVYNKNTDLNKRREYMKNNRFNDFYEAYNFLKEHKMTKTYSKLSDDSKEFETDHFYKCLDVNVVKVNPKTCELEHKEDRLHLNTKTKVWLEFGAWCEENNSPYHDYDLDCGGDTFEEAIIKLANLVDKYYDKSTGKKVKSDYGLI